MPPGLRHDSPFRIDQDQRRIGGRGAGRHVARVLLVPRRIGDDERAPGGGKAPVRDVDGDPLLPFRPQPVNQERKVDVAAAGSVPSAVGADARHLVAGNIPGFEQQPADQGRLPVVHAAAGNEAQDVALAPDVRGRLHQK